MGSRSRLFHLASHSAAKRWRAAGMNMVDRSDVGAASAAVGPCSGTGRRRLKPPLLVFDRDAQQSAPFCQPICRYFLKNVLPFPLYLLSRLFTYSASSRNSPTLASVAASP